MTDTTTEKRYSFSFTSEEVHALEEACTYHYATDGDHGWLSEEERGTGDVLTRLEKRFMDRIKTIEGQS